MHLITSSYDIEGYSEVLKKFLCWGILRSILQAVGVRADLLVDIQTLKPPQLTRRELAICRSRSQLDVHIRQPTRGALGCTPVHCFVRCFHLPLVSTPEFAK